MLELDSEPGGLQVSSTRPKMDPEANVGQPVNADPLQSPSPRVCARRWGAARGESKIPMERRVLQTDGAGGRTTHSLSALAQRSFG